MIAAMLAARVKAYDQDVFLMASLLRVVPIPT
jgi:hypothetical protein